MGGYSCFAFVGSSSRDLATAAHVEAQATLRPSGICYTDVLSGRKIVIPTAQRPTPGAKITALSCIDPALLQGIIAAEHAGGGAVNQAVHFAQRIRDIRASDPRSLTLVDSSEASSQLVAQCAKSGIRLVSLGLHHSLVNVISPFQQDRLILRSPVMRKGCGSIARLREETYFGNKAVVICASPKDASLAQEMFSLPGTVRYLQPSGSLAAHESLELARRCHYLACNATELCVLARDCGLDALSIDENSRTAARDVVTLLAETRRSTVLRCSIAAVTLGRHGCVVVDFGSGRAYEVKIVVFDGCGVATRSGAGDMWHAEWVFNRELCRLPEPTASVKATRAVAQELGLRADQFAITVAPVDIPRAVLTQLAPLREAELMTYEFYRLGGCSRQ
jgi:sugar/nucleoside kinase (ribokinase family)